MKVIATAKGYLGEIREVGDKFYVPPSVSGSWFHPVDDAEEDQPEPKAPAKGKAKKQADDDTI